MSTEPQEQQICDREQCGWIGIPPKTGSAEAVANNVVGLITCGPCAMLIFAVIFGIFLGFIWEPLTYVGMALGAVFAILLIIGNVNRTSCPACKRGHVEPITSEHGRAMLERNRIRYGSDRNQQS